MHDYKCIHTYLFHINTYNVTLHMSLLLLHTHWNDAVSLRLWTASLILVRVKEWEGERDGQRHHEEERKDRAMESLKHEPEGISSWIHTHVTAQWHKKENGWCIVGAAVLTDNVGPESPRCMHQGWGTLFTFWHIKKLMDYNQKYWLLEFFNHFYNPRIVNIHNA